MTLLASLPFGDRLERLDVPADERCKRHRPALLAARHALVFELHFVVLAQESAAERWVKVLASRCTIVLSTRLRTTAV